MVSRKERVGSGERRARSEEWGVSRGKQESESKNGAAGYLKWEAESGKQDMEVGGRKQVGNWK